MILNFIAGKLLLSRACLRLFQQYKCKPNLGLHFKCTVITGLVNNSVNFFQDESVRQSRLIFVSHQDKEKNHQWKLGERQIEKI